MIRRAATALGQVVRAVDGVNLELQQGKVLAIVGESGCGKSVTAFSILQLISPPGRLVGGQVVYRRKDGETVDLAALAHDSRQLKSIRGNDIAMIFQEPMLAFSPVYTIGNQISEVIRLHQGGSKKRALDQTIALLEHVGVSAPAKRVEVALKAADAAKQRFAACHRYRELALQAATYENRPLYRVNVAG